MKTTNKKLVSGLLIGLFITTVGAALVTAQTEETTEENTLLPPFEGRYGLGPFACDLTDEQQAELKDLLDTLRNQNATREEIQAVIQEKLDEFGVLDARLENEIAQTEQRLAMLNRQKELREQGYSWDEINTIIQEEFDLEEIPNMGKGMMHGHVHGFGRGPCDGQEDFIFGEELEQ